MSDTLKRLQIPAIGLIGIGSLNGFLGLLALVTGLMRLTGLIDGNPLPTNEAEKMGFLFGTFISYGIAFLSLITSPIVVFGGSQMLKGKRPGLAKVSSVLVMLPFTACCFVLGIPFGIWSLIVLTRPEVKLFFNSQGNMQNNNPPQPPNF